MKILCNLLSGINSETKMIKKLTLTAVLFISLYSVAYPQNHEPAERVSNNTVYGQLLGYGFFGTLGYERLFSDWFGGNVGLGYVHLEDDEDGEDIYIYFIPVYASLYPVGNSHRLYVDVGLDIITGKVEEASFESDYGTGVIGLAGIGYNYHPSDGGFYFKIGPSVFFGRDFYTLWGGITFGYSF